MLLYLKAVFKILPQTVATQFSLKIIQGSRGLGVILRVNCSTTELWLYEKLLFQ